MSALLTGSTQIAKSNLLETESYDSAFGSKQTRKRPKLAHDASDYTALMQKAVTAQRGYNSESKKDSNVQVLLDSRDERKDDLFLKGQSKRIWAELYKVLDCSDVVIEVMNVIFVNAHGSVLLTKATGH
jgi:nuclear GTP-binding protein